MRLTEYEQVGKIVARLDTLERMDRQPAAARPQPQPAAVSRGDQQTFNALKKEALAAGVPVRDVNMAMDKHELTDLIAQRPAASPQRPAARPAGGGGLRRQVSIKTSQTTHPDGSTSTVTVKTFADGSVMRCCVI